MFLDISNEKRNGIQLLFQLTLYVSKVGYVVMRRSSLVIQLIQCILPRVLTILKTIHIGIFEIAYGFWKSTIGVLDSIW